MKKILVLLFALILTCRVNAQTLYYNQLTDDISVGVGSYDNSHIYFSIGSYSSMDINADEFSLRVVNSFGQEKFNIARFANPTINRIITDDGYTFSEYLFLINTDVLSYICNCITRNDILYINGRRCNGVEFVYIVNQLNKDFVEANINIIVNTHVFGTYYPFRPRYTPFIRRENYIRFPRPNLRVIPNRSRPFTNPPMRQRKPSIIAPIENRRINPGRTSNTHKNISVPNNSGSRGRR